jgi:hypothetical protein
MAQDNPIHDADSGAQFRLNLEGGNEMEVEYSEDQTAPGQLVNDGTTYYRVVETDNGIRLKSNKPEDKQTDYCGIESIEHI